MIIALNNVPANATVRLASSQSYVSSQFLHQARVVTVGSAFYGRVFASIDNTPVFVNLRLTISSSLSHDVVLGRDWQQCVHRGATSQPIYPDGGDEAAAGEFELPTLNGRHGPQFRCGSAPVEDEFSCGYSIIYATLFGNSSTLPFFRCDYEHVQNLMRLHGVAAEKTLSSSRQALCHHLVSGLCVSGDGQACKMVSRGFMNATHLSVRILRDLSEPRLASVLPTEHLRIVASSLGLSYDSTGHHFRRDIQSQFRARVDVLQCSRSDNDITLADIFQTFERHNRATIVSLCSQHYIPVSSKDTSEELRLLLSEHLASGSCTTSEGVHCQSLRNQWLASAHKENWMIFLLSSVIDSRISLKPLQRLLKAANVPFRAEDSLSRLRSSLRSYIRTLSKGKGRACYEESTNVSTVHVPFSKAKEIPGPIDVNAADDRSSFADTAFNWPHSLPSSVKDDLIRMFQERTSSASLATSTCASCGEDVSKIDLTVISTDDFDYNILIRPDRRCNDEDECVASEWLDDDVSFHPPMPLTKNPLLRHFHDILLDPLGIVEIQSSRRLRVQVCTVCHKALKLGRVPPLALANRTFLGDVPDELRGLTVVEEAMIARCRAKCWIVQLKEEFSNIELPNNQRGVKGHIIIYPQNASAISNLLPPAMDDMISPICVLFVGAHPPSAQWLREKAKPLAVRPAVVRRALKWLKKHNPLYKDIIINESVLSSLAESDILPVSIQHVQPSVASETQTSRYDVMEGVEGVECQGDIRGAWQNVVITNVDGEASANALRAAAFRHVNERRGAYVQIPHDPTPANEFIDPSLFPMIYPTLFPYGIGGFKDKDRESGLSMQRHAKHLFNLKDRRFQEHYSFLFTVFNMLQRHSILLHTKLKTQRSNFDKLAATLADVDGGTIHSVIERMSRGETVSEKWTEKEAKLFTLLREVSAISSNVPGSVSARTTMRNEIRALMVDKGLPNFYIMINPADVYNPIVNVLAGAEIDIDSLLDKDILGYWTQSSLVAKNPAVAAKFFNLYMKAFISCLLGYDIDKRQEGVLGVVKAYYGCVEAQGRGTLHCHMLVWIEGAFNPNELKKQILTDEGFQSRLISYLDDIISNKIPDVPCEDINVPSDKHHPCSVRGVRISLEHPRQHVMRAKDMTNLVSQCQKHTHSRTCYKYFKGAPGERKECRFNLDENNTRKESVVDPETGEIFLRKIDGMVNNFNATILEAMRCNMDIQFVGSGVSAKAMIYYMTDYITKSSLKTHVALAALELAVNQTGKYVPDEADVTFRAKTLLRKCAYTMLSHQELSAPQVASYLMGYEDHFKSHSFANLYWPSCERLIDKEDPSPECRKDYLRQPIDSVENETCVADRGEGDSDPHCGHEEPLHSDVDDEGDSDIGDDPETADDEVLVSVNAQGQLVASIDFVEDYRFRGDALSEMSLWEFRARIQKVKMIKSVKVLVRHTRTSSYFLYRKEPYIPLKKDHQQSETHLLRLLPWKERLVPVPVGPKIPRRDMKETLPRFCRLMLILFKPWISAADLRHKEQSWEAAYEEFIRYASVDVSSKIENTQILHECRDSRDTHFAERRRRQSERFFQQLPHSQKIDGTDDVFADVVSHEEVLQHLESIQSCYDQKMDVNRQKMMECLKFAESYGLYEASNSPVATHDGMEDIMGTVVRVSDQSMEDIWELDYENRRNQWKKKAAAAVAAVPCPSESSSSHLATAELGDGIALRTNGLQDGMTFFASAMPDIQNNGHLKKGDDADTAEGIISKWNLNREQCLAFRIVAERSMERDPPQLRMFLGGAGGAGKSWVVNALREYFERKSQSRRLRLASFTGVAARNILGITLHASLFINQRTCKRVRAKTLRDLIAVWEGVDFLIVDEVSMVGCSLLHDISKALSEAKSNSHPFGGVHIIFVGDFAQLPPVCETRLYARLNPYCSGGAIEQKKIFGKLLWLSVDTVVVLSEIKRQCGVENNEFVELLTRLRSGRCTLQDFVLLNSRLLSRTNAARSDPSLRDTPILVTQNAVKDFMNEKGVESFSRRTGRDLHWYYAIDKINGEEIKDPHLRDHLRGLSTSQTSQRLGRLPLVVGMPVMITQNFDVEHGIVNGSMGTLKGIRYTVGENGDRHATSCVVNVPGITGPNLKTLNVEDGAVIRDTVSMNFRHPFSGKNCSIKRTQLPLVPAFCLTVHKAQGQTLDQVIVDLQDCRGTEAPYVMLSRARSLQGLHILRPFQYKKITAHPSEEVRTEFRRLELLRLQTLKKYGNDEEKMNAEAALHGACIMFGDLENVDLTKPASKQLLADAQQTVLEQTALLENHDDSASRTRVKRFRHISLDTTRRIRRRID